MNALLSESPASNALSTESPSSGEFLTSQLDEIEFALLEARNRILSALDRELAEVRFRKEGTAPAKGRKFHFHEAGLPANVLPLHREFIAPVDELPSEAKIDPALERATIEELNAALEAAFSHMNVK